MPESVVPQNEPVDVLVCGAGPNGLMLACELALAGVRPVVLEKLTEPTDEQRANGLVGQVVRLLDRRGLLERLTGSTEAPTPASGFVFGAFPLDLATLPDNPLYTVMVPQRRLEQMLAGRAAELGVEIRRGHQLTGLSQEAETVTAQIAGPTGEYRLTARFLVGADGGSSATRKLAGIGFPGVSTDRAVSRTGHVGVPDDLLDPATGGLQVPGYGVLPPFLHQRTETGMIAWAPLPGRTVVTTVEWPGRRVTEHELTLDELRASVGRVLGADVPLQAPAGGSQLMRLLTGSNTRVAERYRNGRVFLIGDAAHVHLAIGGPGLNLGLQDAVNLAWKLAGALHGWAPEGLLDSYQAERRPAAQRVTMSTQAQGVLIGPGPEVTALRELFAELLRDEPARQRIAELLAGADLRYQTGESELVGRWAPDLLLQHEGGPVRLAQLTRDGRPLLLDLTGDGGLVAEGAPWKDRVDLVRATAEQAPAEGLLVRPDGYLAWAGGPGLRDALARWFGN